MGEQTAIERQNKASEIITSGHIWAAVWYLAWPTALYTLILTAYRFINRIFFALLPHSTMPLSASGVGEAVMNLQFALTIGLGAGAAALVARSIGAGQDEDATDATRQSLILAVLVGAVSGLLLMVFARPLVVMAGAKPSVAAASASFMAILSLSSAPMFIYMIAATVLRSAGDVKGPLIAGALMIVVNVLLDRVLILGMGRVPSLGVRGAAMATDVSRLVGMGIVLWRLRDSSLGKALAGWHVHFVWFRRITNIGWPATLQQLLLSVAYIGLTKILGLLPDSQAIAAQAALTIAITIEATAFMPGVAYGSAATPLVGQNLGAGKPKRAEQTAWVATGQAVGIMSIIGFLFLVIPRLLARPFVHSGTDLALLPLIVGYLQINSVSEPFLALNIVLRGALQGAGDTRASAVIAFATYVLIRLALAYELAIPLRMGATGVWIAMSATAILSGILMTCWFKWGGWRTLKL